MKVAVIVFPGSSGAPEMTFAYRDILKQEVVEVWHQEEALPPNVDLVVIPAGAAYGDYLRPGALAKSGAIVPAIRKFARDERPVLGVGNGFQILCEIGILPGILVVNAGMKFLNHEPYLMVESNKSPFLSAFEEGDIIKLPIACYHGRYYGDNRVLRDLQENECVSLRYCDKYGDVDLVNPFNGSLDAIAGITSRHFNVFGTMVHPERAVEKWQGSDIGLKILAGPLGLALTHAQ